MIWVIGESMSLGGSHYDTQDRLADLLGVTRDAMLASVLWLNLFEYPGTNPKRYVRLIEEGAHPVDAVILLGRRVQRAFGLDIQPLSIVRRNGGRGPTLIAVPHTSSLNRWWNDPDHVEDASIALRAIWGGHSRA